MVFLTREGLFRTFGLAEPLPKSLRVAIRWRGEVFSAKGSHEGHREIAQRVGAWDDNDYEFGFVYER